MTDEERIIDAMWADGHSGKAIANELGWKLDRVYGYVNRHRDRCPARYNKLTQEERDTVHAMMRDGSSIDEIALYLGTSRTTVYRNTRELRGVVTHERESEVVA